MSRYNYKEIQNDIEKRLATIDDIEKNKKIPRSSEKLVNQTVLKWYLDKTDGIPEDVRKRITKATEKRALINLDNFYPGILDPDDEEAFKLIFEMNLPVAEPGFFKSLEDSIAIGNIDDVKKLIRYNSELAIKPFWPYNEKDPSTALILAAKANRLDMVEELLAISGSNKHIDFKHDSKTALDWAYENNNLKIADLLIRNGATPLSESKKKKEKEKENSDSNAPPTEGIARSGSNGDYPSNTFKSLLQKKILAQSRKISDLDEILEKYLNERINNRQKPQGKTIETKQYLHWKIPLVGHFFQKSFDEKKAAVNALRTALGKLEGKETVDTEDLLKHLSTLRNGELGNKIRAFVQDKNANAIVDQKVETVTQFITALQDMISEKPDESKDESYRP